MSGNGFPIPCSDDGERIVDRVIREDIGSDRVERMIYGEVGVRKIVWDRPRNYFPTPR